MDIHKYLFFIISQQYTDFLSREMTCKFSLCVIILIIWNYEYSYGQNGGTRDQVKFPKGYSIVYGGQFENLERAGKRLTLVIPLTFLLVSLLLFVLFKNLRDTLVTMLCIPFAVIGGAMALMLRGYNFNVSAGVGFVSLFGVSVMAGVLLVSAYNKANKTNPLNNNEWKLLVNKASVHELRPILMMLLVAIIGLIPAARSSGIGSDVQRPLATVIIGGLTTVLLFVPFVFPPLYYLLNTKKIIK